jgi:hypothetical protein
MESGNLATNIIGYITGPGLVPQLLLTVIIVLAFYTVVTMIETIVQAVQRLDRQTTVLFEDTVNSRQTIVQEPGADSLLYNSENELNGMEFTYSMYLFINPETFEANTPGMKHIFHKGSKSSFPLMAPGLFVDGKVNTLRLYMNSTTAWDNFVEIPNIPIGKWFHLVVTQKGKYLDVFVNGNVTVRHEFKAVPKLNYGHIYVMDPIKFTKDNFAVDGAMKGMVSRLKYYAYALNYSQIDSLYREGPSKVILATAAFKEAPPYFHDDWWVTKY